MAALGPELIPPAEVVVVEALPTLMILAALFFALGCVKLVDGFVRAMFGTLTGAVGWIPFAGKVVRAPIHKIEQKVTHFLGRAEQKIDAAIGASFHKLARIVRHIGRELEGLAHDLWIATKFLAAHPSWSDLRRFTQALLHPLRTAGHIRDRLIHVTRTTVKIIHQTVAAGVWPRLHGIERELDHVIEFDVAALRARARAIDHRLARLFKWVRAHPREVATAAFTAATAVALARLGGRWIRCKNWRRIGSHVCGLPISAIEGLLALTLAFLVVVRPRDLARAAIETEELMHDLIVKIAEAAD